MQAFSATLEEVADADLLLLVADVNDPDREQHQATVENILGDLGAGDVPRMIALNKCDLLSPDRLALERENAGPETYLVSALDRPSTRPLINAIEAHLWERGRVERPSYAAIHHTTDLPEDDDDGDDATAEAEGSADVDPSPTEELPSKTEDVPV